MTPSCRTSVDQLTARVLRLSGLIAIVAGREPSSTALGLFAERRGELATNPEPPAGRCVRRLRRRESPPAAVAADAGRSLRSFARQASTMASRSAGRGFPNLFDGDSGASSMCLLQTSNTVAASNTWCPVSRK